MQVGKIPKGVNPSSLGQLQFSGKLLKDGVQIGIVAGLVAITVRPPISSCASYG